MATKRTKSEDSERLDSAHFDRVIELLEPKDGSKAGTKKDACAILGIAYNTTRLGTLIQKYKDDKERDAKRRAEKRGTPATQAEIEYIVIEYLEGGTIDGISKQLFRGASFVNGVLDRCSVPIRTHSYSYFRPGMVPDEAVRDSFKVGERVYSMRYDSLARIDRDCGKGAYRIYLLADKWQQSAYQPAEELASLDPIRKLGIKI